MHDWTPPAVQNARACARGATILNKTHKVWAGTWQWNLKTRARFLQRFGGEVPSPRNRALAQQLHQERRAGILFESIITMRCQAAFLFVLLTATCCLAADNLLRQQHEQELLRAKVCGLPMLLATPGWLRVARGA